MYHCHLQIYLISRQPDGFAAIRDMAPMEFFTHTFFESSEPQQALAARADLILVDLQGMDAACETKKLAAWKKPEADLVVLAGKEQVQVLRTAFRRSAISGRCLFHKGNCVSAFFAGSRTVRRGKTTGRQASIWNPPSTVFPI